MLVPDGMASEKAVVLLTSGLTVYKPLKELAEKDKKCAVIGFGGAGHLAIQIANSLGMKTTAFIKLKEK